MMTSGDGPEKRNRDSATAMDAKHKHPRAQPQQQRHGMAGWPLPESF